MKTQQYLQSEKYSKLMFSACFAAYTASYIGRINFSAVLPEIIGNGLFTKTEAGIIGSAFFFVYGAFQIVNGFLGDRFSPFKMITAGTLLSAGANTAMTFCTTNTQMAFVWGFNGFALSLLWAAILKILANIINDGMRAKACLNISATLPIGTILAYLFASLSVKYFNWKFAFYIPSAILLGVGIFFGIASVIVKPRLTQREIVTDALPENKKSTYRLFPLLVTAGIFLILPADIIYGLIKEGISTWTPTMITEVYSADPSFSAFLSILLPILNITGVYIITPIYKKIFKKDELKTGAAIILFALVPLSSLIFMERLPSVVSVALLAVITTALSAYNYMIITLVPMQFSYCSRTATVTGIMNTAAYGGCAAASYGFGIISDRIGWNGTVFVWIGLAVITFLITLGATGRWKKFKETSELPR